MHLEQCIAGISTMAHKSAVEDRHEVLIGSALLPGELTLPGHAIGIVIFAHGSGSSRYSPRNKHVAQLLNNRGLATLLYDLLSAEEDKQRENVFNVELLAGRVQEAIAWAGMHPEVASLPIGLFGASTGAAAALIAAAREPRLISAVVCRGGRPDLAGLHLAEVRAPTLMILGAKDPCVIQLNQTASLAMQCTTDLKIIPRATHLFEEEGTLDEVAALAAAWFEKYLQSAMPRISKKINVPGHQSRNRKKS